MKRPTTRNTVPRLILIIGWRCARDMVKALTVEGIDEAFAQMRTRVALKEALRR